MNILKRQDWLLTGSVLFLAGAGLVIIVSVAAPLFWQQFIWLLVAVVFLVLASLINWQSLINYRWFIWSVYGLAILSLIATHFLASPIRGTSRWLVFGPLQFQTSELVKLALVVMLASFFASHHIKIAHLKTLLISFIYFLVPAVFIFQQPDLGAVIVIFGIWLGFLLVSGLKKKHLLVGFLILLVIVATGWGFLRDYQQDRLIGFFNTAQDPLGINYNVIQSKIAVGSAGFWGKGFNQGTQVQLGFLPEAATDFALAAFIEEWGLLGGLAVIGVFLILIWRILKIGWRADDNFSGFLCLGIAIMFLLQFILNVGSALALVPVVGMTFPFFSYGGSSLLINAILIGMVQSVAEKSKF